MHSTQYIVGLLFIAAIPSIFASHYRGGIITWRPVSTTPSGSTAQILIRQRHAWRRTFFSPRCDDARITAGALVGSGTGTLRCYAGTGCGSYTTVTADVKCTDFSNSTVLDFSAGETFNFFTLPLSNTFTVGFFGVAWMSLAIRGNGDWQITGKVDLTVRPDGILNTSPVTSTLPVIYKTVNVQHVHIIPMSDGDDTDTLRCRWSTASGNWNGYNECGSVCAPTLPSGYQLFGDNCTLVFTLTATNYYAVALQIEDFYTSSSSTPMSSVPIQFLFLGRTAPSGCSTPPSIIGVRPNIACIGTPIGLLTNETVIAQVGCPGKTITEFVTSSPIGLRKSAILNPSAGIYIIILTWIPVASQVGPQGFCAGAVDNTGVQSNPWCITFLVNYTSPNLQKPMFVQGSASPLGTVFANHSIFSIQSVNGVNVNRPRRNGTYINFVDATAGNVTVLSYDCGWSSNVIYSGSTVIINTAPFVWTHAHFYYVTFDNGVSSGTEFCRAESEPLIDSSFWRFNIWDPAVSSTTTSTTTAPTTPTVTTLGQRTTTPIANLTTTGIVVTTTTPRVTTATTNATTTVRTTTARTTVAGPTTTTTAGSMTVMSAKDFEEICKQPIAIGTAVSMGAMLPLKVLAMYALFTKIENMFNPKRSSAAGRQNAFSRRHAWAH